MMTETKCEPEQMQGRTSGSWPRLLLKGWFVCGGVGGGCGVEVDKYSVKVGHFFVNNHWFFQQHEGPCMKILYFTCIQ